MSIWLATGGRLQEINIWWSRHVRYLCVVYTSIYDQWVWVMNDGVNWGTYFSVLIKWHINRVDINIHFSIIVVCSVWKEGAGSWWRRRENWEVAKAIYIQSSLCSKIASILSSVRWYSLSLWSPSLFHTQLRFQWLTKPFSTVFPIHWEIETTTNSTYYLEFTAMFVSMYLFLFLLFSFVFC